MKFLNFFLFLGVIFALLDPDPDIESGFETLTRTTGGLSSMARENYPELIRSLSLKQKLLEKVLIIKKVDVEKF
jgi:hypothetical protein